MEVSQRSDKGGRDGACKEAYRNELDRNFMVAKWSQLPVVKRCATVVSERHFSSRKSQLSLPRIFNLRSTFIQSVYVWALASVRYNDRRRMNSVVYLQPVRSKN